MVDRCGSCCPQTAGETEPAREDSAVGDPRSLHPETGIHGLRNIY
jgi:hypothetical protein